MVKVSLAYCLSIFGTLVFSSKIFFIFVEMLWLLFGRMW